MLSKLSSSGLQLDIVNSLTTSSDKGCLPLMSAFAAPALKPVSTYCSHARPLVPEEEEAGPGLVCWGLMKSCGDWWQPFSRQQILFCRPI